MEHHVPHIALRIHRMYWSYGARDITGVFDAYLDDAKSDDDRLTLLGEYGMSMTILAVWFQLGLATAVIFALWATIRVCGVCWRACGFCHGVPTCAIRPTSRITMPTLLLAAFVCVILTTTAMVVTHVVGHKSFFSAIRDAHASVVSIGDTIDSLAWRSSNAAAVAPTLASSLDVDGEQLDTLLDETLVARLNAMDSSVTVLDTTACNGTCAVAATAMSSMTTAVRASLAVARAGDIAFMAFAAVAATNANIESVRDFSSAMISLSNTTQDIEDAADTALDYANDYEAYHYAATLTWSTIGLLVAGLSLLVLWAASGKHACGHKAARTACTTSTIVIAIAMILTYLAYLSISAFTADLCKEVYARRDNALRTTTAVDDSTGARVLRACANNEAVVRAFDILPWSTLTSAFRPPEPVHLPSFVDELSLMYACRTDGSLDAAVRAQCVSAHTNATAIVALMDFAYTTHTRIRTDILALVDRATAINSVTCGAVYRNAQSALDTSCDRTLHTVFAAAFCSFVAGWVLIFFTCLTAHVERDGCDPSVCVRRRVPPGDAPYERVGAGDAAAVVQAGAAVAAAPRHARHAGAPGGNPAVVAGEVEMEPDAPVRAASPQALAARNAAAGQQPFEDDAM